MEQQQQQREMTEEEVVESYLDAQRAGVEAAAIGRATLAQAQQQGEQLDRADRIADETQYSLDKAGRVLRGMTWSGWVANMFTRDAVLGSGRGGGSSGGGGTQPPATPAKKDRYEPPLVYDADKYPEKCRDFIAAIQNYHANLNVLAACETDEQRETCKTVCDAFFDEAMRHLRRLFEEESLERYAVEFHRDLTILRDRQHESQANQHQQQLRRGAGAGGAATVAATAGKKPPPGSRSDGAEIASSPQKGQQQQEQKTSSPSSKYEAVHQRQEQHLEVLSGNLDELGSIASTLGDAVGKQNQTIGSLENKSENILESSKRVTRRTDRLIQSKSWSTPVRPTCVGRYSIRHVDTGRYLAVVNGDLYLVPRYHDRSCVFSMWKRGTTSSLFGLRSRINDKWVGQNFFGSLACTATSFGHREEWEADADNMASTTLLCASAGWGAGGYLRVRLSDGAVLIGKSGVEEKKIAARWCIEERLDE